jgi:glycerol-3-phosphate dehydrogenase
MQGATALAADYARSYPFLRPEWIDRLVKCYGTTARSWLGNAQSLGDLGKHFGHGLTSAEVDHLISREWARSAEDILWRRSKLGLRFDVASVAALGRYVDAHIGREPQL